MDTTTSLKMTSLAVQSLFSYVEEENLAAIKAHLDKFKDVDSRSDVSQPYHNKPLLAQDVYFKDKYAVIKVSKGSGNRCFVGKGILDLFWCCNGNSDMTESEVIVKPFQ